MAPAGSFAFPGRLSSGAVAAGADALLPLAHRRRALQGTAVGAGWGCSRLRWDERFWWARVYNWTENGSVVGFGWAETRLARKYVGLL